MKNKACTEWTYATSMARNCQNGFTLIELMIVVAIVGVLAAAALPAYNDYVVKAYVTELLTAAGECKTKVQDIYDSTGQKLPSGNVTTSLCSSNNAAIDVSDNIDDDAVATNGQITIFATADFSAKMGATAGQRYSIRLKPCRNHPGLSAPRRVPTSFSTCNALADTGTDGRPITSWVCGPNTGSANPGVPMKYLPTTCRFPP